MKRVWYLPTTDTDGKPLCVKVNVLGENGQWRQLHVVGQPYKGEGEIIVHARHVTQDWLAAWKKAKRMSRFRTRCPRLVNSDQIQRSKEKGAPRPEGRASDLDATRVQKENALAVHSHLLIAGSRDGGGFKKPVTAGRDPQDDFSPCRVAGLTGPVRSRGSVRG